MKKTTFLAIIALLLFNSVNAQVLYDEDFDNFQLGNLSTDLTGATPGQGGWSTLVQAQGNNSDFQIISETSIGKVLAIKSAECITTNNLRCGKRAFKEELDFLWQNRTQGNNVLKLEFDFYTGEPFGNQSLLCQYYITIFSNDPLGTFTISPNSKKALFAAVPDRRYGYDVGGGQHYLLHDSFPDQTWVKAILYIDFIKSQIYFEVPSLGITHRYDLPFQLNTSINPQTGFMYDSPKKIQIDVGGDYPSPLKQPQIVKVDNFKLSAINTAPTAHIKDIISSKFNIFPNPATNIVNITNSENIFIKQVEIYDLAGKSINTQNFNNEAEIQLNIENLPNGTYILHLQTNEGVAVKKLIKN